MTNPLKIQSLHIDNFGFLQGLQISEIGRMNLIVGKNNSGKSLLLQALQDYSGKIPCQYVESHANISISQLEHLWGQLKIKPPQREAVLRTLQCVDANIEDVLFVGAGDDQDERYHLTPKVVVKGSDSSQFLGRGVLWALKLALKASTIAGGVFLVDDIESGLHYSVQDRIWRQLFTMAEDFDLQIFATTHSWDCVASFAEVAAERNDTTKSFLFRMGRSVRASDHGKIIATAFTGEELKAITQADMEVR